MIRESMLGRSCGHLHGDVLASIFSPDEVYRRAVATEEAAIALPNDRAESSDYFQKAAFPTIVRPNENGKVTQIDSDVAQALVILDVNAL